MTQVDIDFLKRFIQTREGVEELIKHMMQWGQQNVHTPFSLCKEMISRLQHYTSLADKKIAVLFNIEFLHVLVNDFGVYIDDIIMFADDEVELEFCKLQYKMKEGVNLFKIDIENSIKEKELHTNEGKVTMKFDVVIGNPPYQTASDNKGAGHTLWDKFVQISLDLTQENGHMCLVHPAGWRRPTGEFVNLGKIMQKKQIKYLEIHSIEDGEKTFGACTRYDWYVLENSPNYENTVVVGEDGDVEEINLLNLPCIPNGKFRQILNLLAKSEKDKINLISDRSNYGADKSHMSKTQTVEFKYPCIYFLPKKGIQLRWSNTNKNGHFGVPKVIFSNGAACEILCDETGKYGLTQWAYGVVDENKNLPLIKQAMESEAFVKLCKYMRFTLDLYDVRFISCLRKDFWKEFL